MAAGFGFESMSDSDGNDCLCDDSACGSVGEIMPQLAGGGGA